MTWQCTRAQLGLIAGNVIIYWVGFIDVMVAVFSWPYLRDVHYSLPYIGMALGAVGMILPTAGFWGTLLKKNAMVKIYFYMAMSEMTALLVYGTYCLIYRGEVSDYIYEHFQDMLQHMPTDVCDCGRACTTVAQIDSCKDDISSALKSRLLGLGIMSLITAMFVASGVFLSFKLLRWSRLTTPILEGGSVACSILSLVLVAGGLYAASGGGWEGEDTLREYYLGLYVSAAAGALIVVVSICGFVSSKMRMAKMLKIVQMGDVLCLVLLFAAGVLCFVEADQLDAKCRDSFESTLRAKQSASFCDKDDVVSTSDTNCNSIFSTAYTCTSSDGTSSCSPTSSYSSLCLSTDQCCSKLLGQSVMPGLWANGCICFYLVLFLINAFFAAKTKTSEIDAEEDLRVKVQKCQAYDETEEPSSAVGVKSEEDAHTVDNALTPKSKSNQTRA